MKGEGLVVSGKGRGGSLARIEGKEPEPEVVTTPEERMAHAREAKTAKSKAKREIDDLINLIVKYCHDEGYPRVEAVDIGFSGEMPIIAVWDEGHHKAQMHTIPQLEYDKLRAIHR